MIDDDIAALGGVTACAIVCGVTPSAVSQAKKCKRESSLTKYISLLSFLHINYPVAYSEFTKKR